MQDRRGLPIIHLNADGQALSGDSMDTSLEKWEKWLAQSLKLDTGYPRIRVRTSDTLKEDVEVQRNGDVFEVEIHAALKNEPERFKEAYDSALRAILSRSAE